MRSPTHLVRAPGRVNLIGEHTDYNGLPVLPTALQRSITIRLRPRDDLRVRLENADARHEPGEFTISSSIPRAPGSWIDYAQAAAQALHGRPGIERGFEGLVSGDIPSAAGLSSSSALVVASALALLAANDVEIDRRELMELTARAERYVGTWSGGMDQAIALGGRAGHAVRIDFDPLRLEPVPVPVSWRFVVSNTFVEARKAGKAQAGYNARVRECREALARAGGSSYREIASHLSPRELESISRALPDPLGRRFRHVVTEGRRVDEAVSAMRRADLETFGRLLNASHASLRDDYEVSCEELDRLASLAREHGAAGARLTGAGFGGCAVLLARETEVERLLAGLRKTFYGDDRRADEGLLVVEPSDGARSIRL